MGEEEENGSKRLIVGNHGDNSKTTTVKWHDFSPDEYAGAAAQVHSVVFAQLGTLSRKSLFFLFDMRA